MEIRPLDPLSPHELAKVLELVNIVYRREMSERFYRWRFLDNPFGPPLVTLLWDGATLAGHYAASPMRSWWQREIASAQSMTTMTHPDYRNRGVFTSLAKDLYERMAALGFQMIWGFPNTQSHYGFNAKLGWRDVAVTFTMTRVLGDSDEAGAVTELSRPAAGADQLWARSDDGRVYPSIRDARYLTWRYVENPSIAYRYLTLPGSERDLLFVVKEYSTSPTTRALEVVDYLYAGAPARFGELMRNVLGWARELGFASVRAWMSTSDAAFGELEKLNFVPREPLTYFGGRTFAPLAIPDARWNDAGFHITMGDSDNY
jgi:hypothetical protein